MASSLKVCPPASVFTPKQAFSILILLSLLTKQAKFVEEAQKQTPPAKPGPTGVQALLKQHKDFINPPPPKVSWKNDDNGRTGGVEVSPN